MIANNRNFDELLNKKVSLLLKKWEVPGCAIAIVHNNETIFAKGYGVKSISDKSPIDEHTIFAIASCTKPFTATAIGILVDEGKIHWDDKVVLYLPEFKLFDSEITNEITIRDLLCHRTGLSEDETDILWINNKSNSSKLISYLQCIQPKHKIRQKFDYVNMMFVVAGQIIKSVTGKTWQEFIKEKILIPLNMNSTYTSTNDLKKLSNVASAHAIINKKLQLIDYRNLDNIAPAGALNSNVIDMSHWLLMNINDGIYNGHQIIKSETLKEIQTSCIEIGNDYLLKKRYPKTTYFGYGLGWFISNYENRKVIDHAGGIDGMISYHCIIPEEKLGIVILTNAEIRLPIILNNIILDHYFNSKQFDWEGLLENIELNKTENYESIDFSLPNNLEIDNLIGVYNNSVFGNAKVEIDNNKLKLNFLGFEGYLKYLKNYTFTLHTTDRFLPQVTVVFEQDKKIIQIILNNVELMSYKKNI